MKLYWLTIIAFGLMSGKLFADDTEIYLGTPDRVNPNVIFIFDTSGSMADSAGSESRLQLVKRAAIDTINDISGINIALMRYNPQRTYYVSGQDAQYRGGFLSTPMLNVDADGVKTILTNTINSYPADGGTPLTEAVHEALNFLRGNTINYGRTKTYSQNSWTYLGAAASNSPYSTQVRNGERYISPITDQCQKNHIVLFTDGDSSVDGESNAQIRNWISSFSSSDRPAGLSTNCTSNAGGNVTNLTNSCIEELAFYMYNSDSRADLEGMQRVNFHAIGGFLQNANSQTFLDNAATFGGGISAAASNYSELRTALTKIFDDIAQSAGIFAAPAVAVNAFNSLEQLDQLYYSVFQPNASVGWSGNLKRFRMRSDGVIVDSKDNPAIDSATGFFAKNAQSFWTKAADAPDGDNVRKGGMASRLSTSRNVYTNIAGNDLTVSANRVREDNFNLNHNHFNSTLTGDEYKKLVRWARGLDVKASTASNPRTEIEDPLHSRPVLVNYGYFTDANNNKVPDSMIFLGTNSGYLHAFDTNIDNPKERYSFIPKELLPIVHDYYRGGGTKKYGLDGQISVWHNDTNRNQIVDNNEKAYLYVGMRRGGRSYYALDISDRDRPKMLWQITGGVTPGFDKLGETWSRMTPADVKWQGQKRKVLFFGGGYDTKEDGVNMRTPHDMGNAIYMVDATTGALLWRASNETTANLRLTSMTSGIVGNIVAVDDNSDGYVDLLYAADLGGRIWRIDFDNSQSNANYYAKGGLIADLGANNSQANNVRFYNTPDVVYSEYGTVWETNATTGETKPLKGIGRYQISIGSGYRAHPLNNLASDHLYVINDYAVSGAPTSYPALRKADLADYSRYSNETNTRKNNGLFYKLPNTGEKVLSNSVTLKDTIYFTTYRPVDSANRSGCEADTGSATLYMIRPDLQAERVIESMALKQSGIVAEGVLITTVNNEGENDGKREEFLLIGAEAIKLDDSGNPFRRTYWREIMQ